MLWLWNATTIIIRHSQTKWQQAARTTNLFTHFVFSTRLLLPSEHIKGLMIVG